MHLTKPTLLLLALTISTGCVLAKPEPQLLEGLWNGLGEAGQNIIDGIVGAGKNGTAIAEDFLDSLKNSTSQFAQDAANFGEQIAHALHKAAAQSLSEFSSLVQSVLQILRGANLKGTDRVRRNALQKALNALEIINSTTVDLEASLADISEQLEEQRQEYAGEIKEQWNDWAADQLERVDEKTDGAGSADAEAIIDELQNRYSAYLHSCLEELQVRQGQYEQKVHETISIFHTATNDLIGKIDNCLKRTSGPISCRRGINEAVAQLQDAPGELISLKFQGLQLLAVGLDAASCVGQTLADYELEKPNVERQLEEIIERYQDENSTTGEDSTTEVYSTS
ncbi:uncharacterized protein [Drosophila pseudoobscura]|uniref:Uncharacterized protein n=1 Tax=Drosophila pseudoobscura pseudoobscura TaxID=46245 RepID=A0A6I8VZX4_DROPS|nr:uncharacterized protein LOC4816138 [Drosophila pseudoobscura]